MRCSHRFHVQVLLALMVSSIARIGAAQTVYDGSFGRAGAPSERSESSDQRRDTELSLPPIKAFMLEPQKLSAQSTVLVKEFRFEGNTAFTGKQLGEVLAPLADRTLTSEQIQEARVLITKYYIEHGYINSGAVLPDQVVKEGVITLKIIEGKLTQVNVHGNNITRTDYLARRVALGAGEPLNVVTLKDSLETIRQNPNFSRINADLTPGLALGESSIDLKVEENPPWHAALQFDNARPPSVGAEEFRLAASNTNLTGRSDLLSFQYGITAGGLDDMRFAGRDDFSVLYVVPITDHDMTFTVGYSRTDSPLVEEPFKEINIDSLLDTVTVGVRQPLYRTGSTDVAISLVAERRHNETSLLGEPFSFSPGDVNGQSDVSVIRFGQEFTFRDQDQLLALRSTFSFGLPVLGATVHSDLPDSQFVTWLAQAQYVRRLFDTQNVLILRSNTQLSSDSLLAMEQLSIGGMNTVRGYRENQLVRDSGTINSAEVHIPLLMDSAGHPILQLAPFIDMGYGWNVRSPHQSEPLSSVGIGLLLSYGRIEGQLFYGYPLRDLNTGSGNLQDSGIHFNLVFRLF